jgi:hypothetical protein
MPEDDFGSGVLEELLGATSEPIEDSLATSTTPVADTAKKAEVTEESFSELEDLIEESGGTATAETEAAATPAATAAPAYDQNQIARAALIGIQAGEFLSWPADKVEEKLAAAEQFAAFQNHYRQQAAQQAELQKQQQQAPPAPPVFDEVAVRAKLSEKYEEAMVEDLLESKRAAHEAKLARLENQQLHAALVNQQQAQQQQAATRAFNDWNSAIDSSVAKLDPAIQEVAKDAEKMKAIRSRTLELGAMYQASGRPIPGPEQLAKDAAFALFGDEIVSAAKGKRGGPMTQQKFSSGTTARTRPTTAPANEGYDAALAGIGQTALYRKLNGLN